MKVIFFKGILRDKIENLIFDRTYSRFSVGPNSLRNFAFNHSQYLLYDKKTFLDLRYVLIHHMIFSDLDGLIVLRVRYLYRFFVVVDLR